MEIRSNCVFLFPAKKFDEHGKNLAKQSVTLERELRLIVLPSGARIFTI